MAGVVDMSEIKRLLFRLLKEVAAFTGGRFQPNPKSVFDAAGRSIPSSMRLWPGLLGLAIVLNLIELFLRKARVAFAK